MTQSQVTPPLTHRRAGHCGSGALRDVFEHYGLDYGRGPLSEGSLFGMAGGLGFFYAEIPGIVPPFYLVGRTGDLELDIVAHVEGTVDLHETEDPAEGWACLRNEIDAGRPAVIWADIAHLEYLRVRMSNTRHVIVVTGYDTDAGVAWIADNDREEIQACSLESLAAARASHGFPAPAQHRSFLYHWPSALPAPEVVVERSLSRAIANMEAQTSSVGGLAGTTGLAGVEAFVERYPLWPETFADGLEPVLAALSVLIVKAGTGGALFRSLHADYLEDFAGLLDRPSLARAAEVYSEAAAAWRHLAETARAADHASGIHTVQRIGELERQGLDAMRDALR